MNYRTKAIVRAISGIVSELCALFTICMAYSAYESSNQTGAGAAQGNLGFYIVLGLVTPIVLGRTAVAFATGLAARREGPIGTALVGPVAIAAYCSVLGVAWNWIYLFTFWR